MKHRKIWSIPIAVLALALMLAGGLVATSVAQAQSIASSRYTFFDVQGSEDPVGTVTVRGLTTGESDQGENAVTNPSNDVVVEGSAVLTGTGNEGFSATVGTRLDEDVDDTDVNEAGTQPITIGVNTSAQPEAGVYNLTLTAKVDLDDSTDGPDAETENVVNDEDRTITTSITIYVIGAGDRVPFNVDPTTAFEGERVSAFGRDLRSNPQYIQITGLGPNSKIDETGADEEEGILASTDGLEFSIDPNNASRIIAKASGAAFTPFTPVDIDFNISVDPDSTVDGDAALEIGVFANLDTTGVIGWLAAGAGPPFSYTVLSNDPAGTVVGEFSVMGAEEDVDGATAENQNEFLDGILLDENGTTQSMFSVRGSDVRGTDSNTTLQIMYTGNGALTTGIMTFRLSVNGDSGIAHRTISDGGMEGSLENLTITVNPVNEGPTGDDSLSVIVKESDKDVGVVLDVDAVITDVSSLVSDTDVLRYTVSDAINFKVGSDGVVKVARAIVDNVLKDEADEEEETPATYMRGDPEGDDTTDGGELKDENNIFSDIEYEFTVNVSDGNAASSHDVKVTLRVDVNEPVGLVTEADDLPASPNAVAYKMVDRDEDGDETDVEDDVEEEDTDTFAVTVEAGNRDTPLTVVDLNGVVSDDDDLKFTEEDDDGDASHLVLEANGNLLLTYVPPGADEDGGRTNWLKVSATDEFNDDPEEGDQEFYLEITVIEKITPIQSEFVGITVPENMTDCSLTDDGEACSLAGVLVGADSYTIESGVDIVMDDAATADIDESDFSVDGSGSITVNNAPDFEADLRPAFIVRVDDANGDLLGLISVRVTIVDENEDPVIDPIVGTPWVFEIAQDGEDVVTKLAGTVAPEDQDQPTKISAVDPEGTDVAYSIITTEKNLPFDIDSASGALTVKLAIDQVLDVETKSVYTFEVEASDGVNKPTIPVVITILNSNESPNFTSPAGDDAKTTIGEDRIFADGPIPFGGGSILVFTATDEDENDLTFELREGVSRNLFQIHNVTKVSPGEFTGELRVKEDGLGLDYDDPDVYSKETGHRVHVEVQDGLGLSDTLLLEVKLNNVNDNTPEFVVTPPAMNLSVPENTARAFVLANYAATDADGDHVYYSLGGDDAKSFTISATGDLMTLESLDADRQVPCGADGCAVDVTASDGERSVSANVRVSVTAIEDSVSTLGVTKANPVPGTEAGHPMSALAGAKTGGDEYLWNLLDCAGMLDLVGASDTEANRGIYCAMWDGLSAAAKAKVSAALTSEAPAESPYSLPASYGSAPVNFVETEWANWGTILRIEVTAESPSATCGNGNQCVVIDVNSDSADTSIKLQAYRIGTQENKFVAALMLVELSGDATDSTDAGVYQHTDGGVAALKVDEEDEIEVEFGNLRGSIDVENEDPEISNFAPEHEAAFDDADVDYTFTVTDSNSGMPEPEDLPDVDGDADYTPVVALISGGQCETHAGDADTVKTDGGTLGIAASINEDESLYCPGTAQDGEYDASVGSTFGFAPIRDDKDFDEIDDGFDVETTIVLRENKTYFVTFIACDNAGNCSFYDPDGNDNSEDLAQITVDTEDPVFVEARTGLTWDSTDNEYDDNRSYIQVIFNDLTTLNTATVEIDDFVVEGHTISDVHIFENPDDDDVDWGGGPNERYAATGSMNLRDIHRYRDLENVVFIELADELLADETPDVTIVPNGVEDSAGNEQDDGDHEADDWISPSFTIVSIVSTRETSQDEILAGDDDEVTVVVTTDERLDSTRPTVTVTYVHAPVGSVRTKGTEDCDDGTTEGGTRERGEIAHEGNDKCLDSDAATGGKLNNSVEKVSNTEWIVTITEPKDTGYYNFRISGKDRSPQENPGSEGVSPGAIVTDFFDADGDVNVDDAIFFEGDINLPKPNVRVSGVSVQDNEADVEFRSPLFVELDFGRDHATCGRNADTDERMANCTNENSEYAEDNFDDIQIKSFVLDGEDITDSVKTTDNQSFLVSLESISIGDHTAEVQAVDQAGNVFEDTLEINFEVNDRDPFEKRLSPGWNLVSLPGEPADSSIASVFGPGVEVRTVYSYDPVIPGGWQVAVRETLDSDWQGDLTEITGQRGYWVLSDAIQDWEVIIPRLAGGASGTGTPIQPPVIPMYAGWNLIPVTDVSGNALSANIEISAEAYLNSLDDGLDLARVLGYDTIRNEWFTVLDKQMGMVVNANLRIGAGYWVFVREAAALVPGGIAGVSGGD